MVKARPLVLDRCAWCKDDVWSDNDHYQADGYTWHSSCARNVHYLLSKLYELGP